MSIHDDCNKLVRNPSRLNVYLPIGVDYTTPTIPAATPTKVAIQGALETSVKDFTLDTGNSRYFLDDPSAFDREFVVHLSNTIKIGAPNHIVEIALYKNGIADGSVRASRHMGQPTDIGNLNLVGAIKLSHLDYIEGYVTVSAQDVIIFKSFSLTINETVGAV